MPESAHPQQCPNHMSLNHEAAAESKGSGAGTLAGSLCTVTPLLTAALLFAALVTSLAQTTPPPAANTGPAATNSGPRIKFAEPDFSFGRVEAGRIVNHDF